MMSMVIPVTPEYQLGPTANPIAIERAKNPARAFAIFSLASR
jgi:hypothetical protein